MMGAMEPRLRVLFAAFYYPPTGGGGVERTIQFSRRLPELGVDVEMLVPTDRKSTRLNSSHSQQSRMPSSA